MDGLRTNCYSRKEKTVQLGYLIGPGSSGGLWFNLKGGPTGYEGFELTEESVARTMKEGWWACAGAFYEPKDGGGGHYYDSLFIPPEEMGKALSEGTLEENCPTPEDILQQYSHLDSKLLYNHFLKEWTELAKWLADLKKDKE